MWWLKNRRNKWLPSITQYILVKLQVRMSGYKEDKHVISPLIDLDSEYQQVPQDIRRSFSTSPQHPTSMKAPKPLTPTPSPNPVTAQTNPSNVEFLMSCPQNIEQFIISIMKQDKQPLKSQNFMQLVGEYTLNEVPKKGSSVNTLCPFCIQLVEEGADTVDADSTMVKSKTLNEYFKCHQDCFNEFLEEGSRWRLVLLGELSLVEYVLGGDQELQEEVKQSPTHFKEAFIEITFYHPVSNRIVYEILKKVIIRESSDLSGFCRFKSVEGLLYDPPFLALPLESYRICLRTNIMDTDELNNKYQMTAVVSSRKVKILPPQQKVTLKFSNKKSSCQIQAKTKRSSSLPEHFICQSQLLLSLQQFQLTFHGLFTEKKRKQTFLSINHSTYSERGINKRKKEDYIDLSPEVRSTNKSITKAKETKDPNDTKDLSNYQKSQSDISFREYQREEKDLNKSDNSRLSYISKELNMEDIQSEIKNLTMHTYLKTQSGSRNLQKYIAKCNEQDITIILKSIEGHISNLMVDHYANFFFKTLCEVCSPKNRMFILSKIQHSIQEISKDRKGTHSIQTLVSMMSTSGQQNALFQMLDKSFISLSKDQQGTHIIKKMIPRLSDQKALVFLEKIQDNLFELVTNQYGIIVVKEIMTRIKNAGEKRQSILLFLEKYFDELMNNAYGNYAVQHALEIFPLKDCEKILNRILNKVAVYSNQKISSNVVQKCIMNTNEETKNRFIVTLARDEVIVELMKNKFGNFVLEKALKTSSKVEHKQLIKAMNKNIEQITNTGMKQKWLDYLYDY